MKKELSVYLADENFIIKIKEFYKHHSKEMTLR